MSLNDPADSARTVRARSRIYEFGAFRLDTLRRQIVCSEGLINLGAKAFDTLVLLIERRGEPVGKEDIARAVWTGLNVTPNTVEQAIAEIRRALKDDRQRPTYVLTVHGRGYQFISSVIQREKELLELPAGSGPTLVSREHRSVPRWTTRHVVLLLAALTVISAAGIAWRHYSALSSRRQPVASSLKRLTATGRPKLSPIVATDQFLYFTEVYGGAYNVMRVPAVGGSASEVEMGIVNPSVCDVSPDGRLLLVRSITGTYSGNGPMWMAPVAGGNPSRLGSFEGFDGSFSPDGRHLALSSGRELHIYDLHVGSRRKQCTRGFGSGAISVDE